MCRIPGTLAGLAILGFSGASAFSPQPPSVTVSQEEVRVVFPAQPGFSLDPSERLECVDGHSSRAVYLWSLGRLEAVVGPRGIGAAVWECRPFESWQDLAGSAFAGVFEPGMFTRYQDTPVVDVRAYGDSLVLLLTDREAIVELFGLRPDSVVLTAQQLGEPRVRTETEVAVRYLEPAIPEPDSALLARAARLHAEDRASRRTIRRQIRGSERPADPLWVTLGDSLQVYVSETICNIDLCSRHSLSPPDSAWSVEDPEIAALRFSEPDLPRTRLHPPERSSRAFLHGLSLGRTMLKASRIESPSDTLMARTRPEPSLEQEVLVTVPPVSVAIVVEANSASVGERGWVRVTLRDEDGDQLRGVPVHLVSHRGGGRYTQAVTEDEVTVLYDRPGVWRHEVTLGDVADTVVVRVFP
jgi:hypothetical protein